MKLVCVFCVLFLICLWLNVHAEMFLAVSHCEILIEIHQNITDVLKAYISKETELLSLLKEDVRKFETSAYGLATKDYSDYMGNTINAFKIIKRLTHDLNRIREDIEKGMELSKDIIEKLSILKPKLPTYKDLIEAALAVRRVEATYQLDVKELARGKIHDVAYSSPMSVEDCYLVSRILYENDDYVGSEAWAIEAVYKRTQEKNNSEPGSQDKDLFLQYLDCRPSRYLHERKLHIRVNFSDGVRKKLKLNPKNKQNDEGIPGDLCRGERQVAPDISKRLTCYLSVNHPYLLLAPIKTEQVHINPDISIFYDVIKDDEIETIKRIANPMLKPALISIGIQTHTRLNKAVWLRDDVSPVVARVSRRVEDVTGLTVNRSELLHVANYGLGGYYEMHKDYLEDIPIPAKYGNRIATVMFYMEVAQGGATVFPLLGLSVFPVKNAALFWMNLHPSGEGDSATLHAGCPVLQGSKWIAIKWIREVGQELLRPCKQKRKKFSVHNSATINWSKRKQH